ncbi:hypothetical protein RDWZM_009276 [Blomia tropicalis]|uniref:Uncharacterized protein n=1 Tax=Blomia tropicalis TaxID=40697 RepID=A0A9Q0M3E2_BLOTA|nr:hypothetical protein RDWZM_009276 [Blomia tropicalis]
MKESKLESGNAVHLISPISHQTTGWSGDTSAIHLLPSNQAKMANFQMRSYSPATTGLSSMTFGGIPTSLGGFSLINADVPMPVSRQYTTWLNTAANQMPVSYAAVQPSYTLTAVQPAVQNLELVSSAQPVELVSTAVQPSALNLVTGGRTYGAVQLAGATHATTNLQPVTAAMASLQRKVEYIPTGYTGEPAQTQVVNVPPNEQGIHINFVSKSSPLTVSSQHIPGEAGQVHVSESEDEPHRLVHNVKKSVIQEVNEVVQPYRILKQEVKPTIEQSHTLVPHGDTIPLSGRASGIISAEVAQVHKAELGDKQIVFGAKPTSYLSGALMSPQYATAYTTGAVAAPQMATYAYTKPAATSFVAVPTGSLSHYAANVVAQPAAAMEKVAVTEIAQPVTTHQWSIAQPASVMKFGTPVSGYTTETKFVKPTMTSSFHMGKPGAIHSGLNLAGGKSTFGLAKMSTVSQPASFTWSSGNKQFNSGLRTGIVRY